MLADALLFRLDLQAMRYRNRIRSITQTLERLYVLSARAVIAGHMPAFRWLRARAAALRAERRRLDLALSVNLHEQRKGTHV